MYGTGFAFWSNAVFMVELLVAEFIMSSGLKPRSYFPLRAVATLVVLFGLSLAFPSIGGVLYSSFLFLSLFALSFAGLCFCFGESLRTVLFCLLAGYATQHIAYELFDITMLAMGLSKFSGAINVGSNLISSFTTFVTGSGDVRIGNAFIFTMYGAVYFFTYWLIYRITSPRMRDVGNLQLKNGAALIIIAMTIAFDIVISAVVGEYGNGETNKLYIFLLDFMNIFCCILTLYQQFSLAKMHQMSNDLEMVNHLLEQSKKQYELTKENIEIINIKLHDLKHQVRTIGKNNKMNPTAVGELEKAISLYDTAIKTGNNALDIILTEKSVLCNRYNISLSCIADGKQLNFMSEPDLYSLFGNILDNAIEAVVDLEDEKKTIGLSVKRVKKFVFVNIYNYYGGTITLNGELPVTTKGGMLHGYGIKSVKLLAERYGGCLKINARNGIFNLDLLFPISGK